MCATAAAAPVFAGAGAAAVEAAAAAISAAIAGTSSQRQQQQQPPCPPGAAAADCSSSRSFYKALMETGGVLRPPVGPPHSPECGLCSRDPATPRKAAGAGRLWCCVRGHLARQEGGHGIWQRLCFGDQWCGFCSEGVVCTLCALCMVRVWTLRQRSSLNYADYWARSGFGTVHETVWRDRLLGVAGGCAWDPAAAAVLDAFLNSCAVLVLLLTTMSSHRCQHPSL